MFLLLLHYTFTWNRSVMEVFTLLKVLQYTRWVISRTTVTTLQDIQDIAILYIFTGIHCTGRSS